MRIKNRSQFQARNSNAYKIENKADESTVYIYDEISWWGIDAQAFAKDFNAIDSKTIHLRVNSPGGSVFDGTTIFNVIKQHKSKVIAHIDGLAASIASIIVLAADEVQMADNAFFMIHDPWGFVVGTAEDMRKEADLLDKVTGTIAKTYIDKTGKEESEILELMAAETWFTADEALEAGFIDSIYSPNEETAKKKSTLFDLTVFNNVPAKLQEHSKEITAREIERILRDAGCSAKQAKGILAEGFEATDQRDVETVIEVPPVEDDVQRDVVLESRPPKDPVDDLLIRAGLLA